MKLFMKPINRSYFLMMLMAVVFLACRGPEAKNASTSSASLNPIQMADGKYSIDRQESVVTWFGSNAIISKGSHTGYAYLSNGELTITNGQLVSGTVEVDMSTIEDEKHGRDNNLVEHLKSADFFEVEKFPFSTFTITMAVLANDSTVNVTGNLTIKGITHLVTFPTIMEMKDGVLQASGKLTIDRTKWDVRYKSKKFFSDLADEIISDDIEFDIKIIAKKNSDIKKTSTRLTAPKNVAPVFLQSKDGGLTWQDISQSLPEQRQPEIFFGESDLYLRINNVMYHSKSNLKTPVWEKKDFPERENSSFAIIRSALMDYGYEGAYQRKSLVEKWLSSYPDLKKNRTRTIFETSGGTVFFGTDFGLYKTVDRGQHWKQIQPPEIRAMVMVESDGVLMATGQKGIMRSTDNGEHWEWVISEGGAGISIEKINGGFAAILALNTTTKSRRIYISVDGGNTWEATELESSMSISSIKQMGNYLISSNPDGIFRSSDLGKTWTSVHPAVDRTQPVNARRIFSIYTSGNTLYAVAQIGC